LLTYSPYSGVYFDRLLSLLGNGIWAPAATPLDGLDRLISLLDYRLWHPVAPRLDGLWPSPFLLQAEYTIAYGLLWLLDSMGYGLEWLLNCRV
jgi:hypothetical protein